MNLCSVNGTWTLVVSTNSGAVVRDVAWKSGLARFRVDDVEVDVDKSEVWIGSSSERGSSGKRVATLEGHGQRPLTRYEAAIHAVRRVYEAAEGKRDREYDDPKVAAAVAAAIVSGKIPVMGIPQYDLNPRLHAEVLLLDSRLSRPSSWSDFALEGSVVSRYLGVSKPMCFLCDRLFSFVREEAPFAWGSSHGEVYRHWRIHPVQRAQISLFATFAFREVSRARYKVDHEQGTILFDIDKGYRLVVDDGELKVTKHATEDLNPSASPSRDY
ncbi:nucleic acid/nucleotide deaminase domain-containing protein [Sorangium sp. So ce854]|uniref:nucleic acid/nucleotide deaminase domain-containing protein n=1 Tax=Sorangium sp. So ce854 TaxID=3133322 RepID=UPI003F63CB44